MNTHSFLISFWPKCTECGSIEYSLSWCFSALATSTASIATHLDVAKAENQCSIHCCSTILPLTMTLNNLQAFVLSVGKDIVLQSCVSSITNCMKP